MRLEIDLLNRLRAIPMILERVSQSIGMESVILASLADARWQAMVAHNSVVLGIAVGDTLELHQTVCFAAQSIGDVVAHADMADESNAACQFLTSEYGLRSGISVPIYRPDGSYFGNLCALDRKPRVGDLKQEIAMLQLAADLIVVQLDNNQQQGADEQRALTLADDAVLREQFLGVLAHDLRNPLAAIGALAEVLTANAVPVTRVPEIGKRMTASVARMSYMIDDVIDFTRARLGGGIALEIKPCADLGRLLELTVDEITAAHPDRLVDIRIAINETVVCDAARLQQLLSNLVSNAFRHGAADVPVKVRCEVEEGALHIAVTNGGPLIDESALVRMFEPFWQAEAGGRREGLGLGLFICRHIVEAHGGDLKVLSSVRDGVMFEAVFPPSNAVDDPSQ
ncbi:sensor histidine kinase [Chitinasiproducens palmae]|uniref:sensor histidine kinase n=1 Tax=Chitinasiproducens palmae TaxID=1770053 RepID=UPI001B8B68B1|nr:HAMP domain-containing sensor histidine kinase [Chitinasiproducens palmae]